MRMSIKARLASTFTAILLILASMAYSAISPLSDSNQRLERLVHVSAKRVDLASGIETDLVKIVSLIKDHIAASETAAMAKLIGIIRRSAAGKPALNQLLFERAVNQFESSLFTAVINEKNAIIMSNEGTIKDQVAIAETARAKAEVASRSLRNMPEFSGDQNLAALAENWKKCEEVNFHVLSLGQDNSLVKANAVMTGYFDSIARKISVLVQKLTDASSGEMTPNTRQSADSAAQAEDIATQSAQQAIESGKSAEETMKTIADRITIIQEIARQADLLALNAATEAASVSEALASQSETPHKVDGFSDLGHSGKRTGAGHYSGQSHRSVKPRTSIKVKAPDLGREKGTPTNCGAPNGILLHLSAETSSYVALEHY
jgi:methyl-accepting chemotaxis protein